MNNKLDFQKVTIERATSPSGQITGLEMRVSGKRGAREVEYKLPREIAVSMLALMVNPIERCINEGIIDIDTTTAAIDKHRQAEIDRAERRHNERVFREHENMMGQIFALSNVSIDGAPAKSIDITTANLDITGNPSPDIVTGQIPTKNVPEFYWLISADPAKTLAAIDALEWDLKFTLCGLELSIGGIYPKLTEDRVDCSFNFSTDGDEAHNGLTFKWREIETEAG